MSALTLLVFCCCAACAKGFAAKDAVGEKFPDGCTFCEGGVSSGGSVTTSQCKLCPEPSIPDKSGTKCRKSIALTGLTGSF
jgi:hypothetical protein